MSEESGSIKQPQINFEVPDDIVQHFADKAGEVERPEELFGEGAVIRGPFGSGEIRGEAAILDWLSRAKPESGLSTALESVRQVGERWIFRTTVSGDFPESPLAFEYRFVLNEGRIENLEIEQLGSLGA